MNRISLSPFIFKPENVVTTLKKDHFWQKRTEKRELKNNLSHIDPSDLNKYINDLSEYLAEHISDIDSVKIMKEFSKYIPQEKLDDLAKINNPEQAHDELIKCKSLFEEAKNYVSRVEGISVTLKSKLQVVLDSIISFIDTILNAFGINDILKPTEGDEDSGAKSQKILMLLGTFALLAATLLPIFGIVTGATIIGATMVTIAVLSVVWPHIKPVSSFVDRADNWSEKIRLGEMPNAYANSEIVSKIASSFELEQKPILLHGLSNQETEIAKAFAQAIERGEFPHLKGKQVFYFETARLCIKSNVKDHSKVIPHLLESMGNKKDKYVFIFGGFDIAFDNRHLATGIDLLKSLQEIPYALCLTSTKAYQTLSTDISSHFGKNIIFNNRSSKEDTIKNLNDFVLDHADQFLFESEKVLPHITEKNNEAYAYEPLDSLDVLRDSLKETQCASPKLENLKTQLKGLQGLRSQTQTDLLGNKDKLSNDIKALEKEIDALEKEINNHKSDIDFVQTGKKSLVQIKLHMYKELLKIKDVASDKFTKKDWRSYNQAFLLNRLLNPLTTKMREKARVVENFKPVMITQALADKFIITPQAEG